MTLRSRLAALERAARRRRERGYPMTPVIPELKYDMADPETVAVLTELTELRRGPPVLHDDRAFARKVMENPELTRRWIAVIDRARAAAPVQQTGNAKT